MLYNQVMLNGRLLMHTCVDMQATTFAYSVLKIYTVSKFLFPLFVDAKGNGECG